MAVIQISELLLRIREAADMRDSQFYDDGEIIGFIVRKYQALWRKMVLQHEDFFVTTLEEDGAFTGEFPPFDASGRLPLTGYQPTDSVEYSIWKHIDIEVNIDTANRPVQLTRVEYKDRYRYGYRLNGASGTPRYYFIHGDYLHTIPAAAATTTYRWAVILAPLTTILQPATDSIGTPQMINTGSINLWAGWEDAIIPAVAGAMWNAQEWDPSFFLMEAQEATQAILESMKPRDMGEARRVLLSGGAPTLDEDEIGGW